LPYANGPIHIGHLAGVYVPADIYVRYLKPGDKVAMVAPSGKIDQNIVSQAIHVLEASGLDIKLGDHLFDDHFQFAGRDDDRLSDLQKMLDDEQVKAIFCARGGYGMIRIIDHLNFTKFLKNPKWIIGFSDITVLLSHVQQNFSIETIHGIMASGISENKEVFRKLIDVLHGLPLRYELPERDLCRTGIGQGELTGGNLAILSSLIGSKSDVDTRNKVLFIEEVGENLYKIERMMFILKRAGKLSQLNGLITGSISSIPDKMEDFGMDAYETIWNSVSEYNYPVYFGFPAGHQKQNYPLIMGREVVLEVGEKCIMTFK
jgi:muramoyltetrapeptide carboxypeptidase